VLVAETKQEEGTFSSDYLRVQFANRLIFEKLSSGQCDTLLQKSEQTDRSSSGIAPTLRLSVLRHGRR
jgi:hypothetical protein